MSNAPRRRLTAVPDTGKPTTPAAAAGGAHGPYGKRPDSPALLPAERRPMLAEALDGVRLGAYDRRALEWLCRWTDTPTFLVLLGVVHRARQAAADRATEALNDRGGAG